MNEAITMGTLFTWFEPDSRERENKGDGSISTIVNNQVHNSFEHFLLLLTKTKRPKSEVKRCNCEQFVTKGDIWSKKLCTVMIKHHNDLFRSVHSNSED